jgi:hypothetical protein
MQRSRQISEIQRETGGEAKANGEERNSQRAADSSIQRAKDPELGTLTAKSAPESLAITFRLLQ